MYIIQIEVLIFPFHITWDHFAYPLECVLYKSEGTGLVYKQSQVLLELFSISLLLESIYPSIHTPDISHLQIIRGQGQEEEINLGATFSYS